MDFRAYCAAALSGAQGLSARHSFERHRRHDDVYRHPPAHHRGRYPTVSACASWWPSVSVVPAAGIVGEAMVLLALMGFVLEKFGGDSLDETRDNLRRYLARTASPPESPIAPSDSAVALKEVRDAALTGTDMVGSGGDD